jgi:hypothetical protein
MEVSSDNQLEVGKSVKGDLDSIELLIVFPVMVVYREDSYVFF